MVKGLGKQNEKNNPKKGKGRGRGIKQVGRDETEDGDIFNRHRIGNRSPLSSINTDNLNNLSAANNLVQNASLNQPNLINSISSNNLNQNIPLNQSSLINTVPQQQATTNSFNSQTNLINSNQNAPQNQPNLTDPILATNLNQNIPLNQSSLISPISGNNPLVYNTIASNGTPVTYSVIEDNQSNSEDFSNLEFNSSELGDEIDENLDDELTNARQSAHRNDNTISIRKKNLPTQPPKTREKRTKPYVSTNMKFGFDQLKVENVSDNNFSETLVSYLVDNVSKQLFDKGIESLTVFDRGVICGMLASNSSFLVRKDAKKVADNEELDASGLGYLSQRFFSRMKYLGQKSKEKEAQENAERLRRLNREQN